MRKRKSPIVLVTLLVVVVAGITGFNYATSKTGNPAAAPPAPEVPEAKAVGEARPATPASAISASVKQSMGGAGTAPGERPGGSHMPPGAPGGPGSGPMILGPSRSDAKPEKPKPNSSSTSSQWFNDNSALGSKKGE